MKLTTSKQIKSFDRMYVGITDENWASFLQRNRTNYGDLINFWTPGGRSFNALSLGELFLFKRHNRSASGENGVIIGGAYFHEFKRMTPSDAWKEYGYGNGASSLSEMMDTINNYRARNRMSNNDDQIGCVILSEPFFFNNGNWIAPPSDWTRSIVRGKSYDRSTKEGNRLFDEVVKRLNDKSGVLAQIDRIENRIKDILNKDKEIVKELEELYKEMSASSVCGQNLLQFWFITHSTPSVWLSRHASLPLAS